MSAAKVRVSTDEVNPNSTNLPTRSPVEEHSFAAGAHARTHVISYSGQQQAEEEQNLSSRKRNSVRRRAHTEPDDVLDDDALGVSQEGHELIGDPLPELPVARHALPPSSASSNRRTERDGSGERELS